MVLCADWSIRYNVSTKTIQNQKKEGKKAENIETGRMWNKKKGNMETHIRRTFTISVLCVFCAGVPGRTTYRYDLSAMTHD